MLGAGTSPTVWVVPALARVGPQDAAGGRGIHAQLEAARGEYESFQVIVQAPVRTPLTNVNLAVSDLTGTAGAVISKTNLSLFREQYILAQPYSPNWGGSNQPLGTGWFADGLIPFIDPDTQQPPSPTAQIKAVPCSIAAGTNQPFWVDVFVPRNSPAGAYKGTFTVTADQGAVTGQIDVRVWNFTLPLSPSLKSAFIYFQSGTAEADAELLRNKVSPLQVSAVNEPKLIQNYALETNNLGFFSGADASHCTMSPPPSLSDIRKIAQQHSSQLLLYDFFADEVGGCPNLYPQIRQWAAVLHQAGIKTMITMSPVPELLDDGLGTGESAADMWVVLPHGYDNQTSAIAQALAKGDEVWSYNTLVQDPYSPKWEIDFAPINFRIQPGFINQSLGLSGLFYWRVDMWASDAWHNVNNAGTFSSNNYPGEGMLVYPGGPVGIRGVAPSMRLKWIRDGVEDYEYIALLKKIGYGAWALQIARGVGPDWTHWTRDPNALEAARHTLGQQLDTLAPDGNALVTKVNRRSRKSAANRTGHGSAHP